MADSKAQTPDNPVKEDETVPPLTGQASQKNESPAPEAPAVSPPAEKSESGKEEIAPVSPIILLQEKERAFVKAMNHDKAALMGALVVRLHEVKVALRNLSDDEAKELGLLSLKKGL